MSKCGAISMFLSLIDAIDEAGGSIHTRKLLKMTVVELLETLGPNGIRFFTLNQRRKKINESPFNISKH